MIVIFYDFSLDLVELKMVLHENLPNTQLKYLEIPANAYEKSSKSSFLSAKLLSEVKKVSDSPSVIITKKVMDNGRCNSNASAIISIANSDLDIRAVAALVVRSIYHIDQSYLNNEEFMALALSEEQKATIGRVTYNPVPPAAHLVISHGILTYAYWAEEASQILEEHNISSSILRYDEVELVKFAFSMGSRDKYAKKMLARLNREYLKNTDKRLSVSVHSYGSIVLAKALELALTLEIYLPIDAVIISGGILPQDFDWQRFQPSSNIRRVSVKRVINICGDEDYWPVMAKAFARKAGNSGALFFADNYSGNLKNIRVENRNHESILAKEIVKEYWTRYVVTEVEACHPKIESISPARPVECARKFTKIVNKYTILPLLMTLMYCTYMALHALFSRFC